MLLADCTWWQRRDTVSLAMVKKRKKTYGCRWHARAAADSARCQYCRSARPGTRGWARCCSACLGGRPAATGRRRCGCSPCWLRGARVCTPWTWPGSPWPPSLSAGECIHCCWPGRLKWQASSSSVLLYIHRDHKDYKGQEGQDGHLDLHTTSELWSRCSSPIHCCFTSTETMRTIRDGVPKMAISEPVRTSSLH